MKRSLFAVFRKEMIHIFRDKQSLFMVFSMPLIMLLLYGYAINMDMKDIRLTVADRSKSPQSRELIRRLDASEFFRVSSTENGVADINGLFQSRGAQCYLEIPADYSTRLAGGEAAPLFLAIDAGDPNSANFMYTYLTAAVTLASGEGSGLFTLEPRILYNSEMRSAPFFVPGLIALILILICALLTSIAIVREKETGTMEQLLVSPVKPRQIILGKVLPYTMLGFLDGLIILGAGQLIFGVAVKGSLLLVMAMMLIYVVTGLSLGMLISTIAPSQSVAMLATVSLTVLPSMLLSGFIFPLSSMPRVFQLVSKIIPATYFLEIIRGIILKGNSLAQLYRPAGILLGLDGILILLSIRSFKIRLD